MKQSAEFRLVAACCIRPSSPAREAAILSAASAPIDWDAFLVAVRRHRVEGLANDGLRAAGVTMPAPAAEALAARAAFLLRHNLANAAEEARLLRTLGDAGVPVLFVKGTTLAMLAYGSLALKNAWDIDMLVAPDDLGAACRALAGLGYARVLPRPDLPELHFRRWAARSKESLWAHHARGVHVELHTALVDNPHLLGAGLGSPVQQVRIAEGVALPTLGRDALYAYLCVHGTAHAWSRLKWLADVAAFAGDDEAEIGRLHRAAVALGAGRCSAVALSLCAGLFGTRFAPPADGATRRLERTALWALASAADGTREFGDRPGEALRYFASHFLLSPRWRFKRAELLHKLLFPYTPGHLALPAWLSLPYTLGRIPAWAWAHRARRRDQDSAPNTANSR